jgi:hypothetical protein
MWEKKAIKQIFGRTYDHFLSNAEIYLKVKEGIKYFKNTI